MSGQMDLERRIDAYFAEGPGRAPDHLLGQSLRAAIAERQVRRPWWPRGLERGARRDLYLVLAGGAGALVIGGLVLLRGGLIPLPGPTDSALPGASSSPTASASTPAVVLEGSPPPSASDDMSATTYTNDAMGLTVDYSETTNAPIVAAYGNVRDAILFPIHFVAADIYESAITVASGDAKKGVWLTGDGARIQASTLDSLEAGFRRHVQGASKAESMAVDGEPARLLLVPKQEAALGAAASSPRLVPVPVVLVVHDGRPYVIDWRDGLLPARGSREERLRAFLAGFQFVDPPTAEKSGPSPSPAPTPIGGRIQVPQGVASVDVGSWHVWPKTGQPALLGAILGIENPRLAGIGGIPHGDFGGLWLYSSSAFVRVFAEPSINGRAATRRTAAAQMRGVAERDPGRTGDITTTKLTLPAGAATRLEWSTTTMGTDDIERGERIAIYFVDVTGTVIRVHGHAAVDFPNEIDAVLTLAKSLRAP